MSIIIQKKREILLEQLKLNEQKVLKIQQASNEILIKIEKLSQQEKKEQEALLNKKISSSNKIEALQGSNVFSKL